MPGLKPEVSLPVALATGALVYTIYNRGMGASTLDLRGATQGDGAADATRRQNAYLAAAVVSGISLLAKDATVFIIGGAMLVGLDWMTRNAIWTDPATGRLDLNPFGKVDAVEAPAEIDRPAPSTVGGNGQFQPVV
jgi:hypothetical protein